VIQGGAIVTLQLSFPCARSIVQSVQRVIGLYWFRKSNQKSGMSEAGRESTPLPSWTNVAYVDRSLHGPHRIQFLPYDLPLMMRSWDFLLKASKGRCVDAQLPVQVYTAPRSTNFSLRASMFLNFRCFFVRPSSSSFASALTFLFAGGQENMCALSVPCR
jgi:hypothetical protein